MPIVHTRHSRIHGEIWKVVYCPDCGAYLGEHYLPTGELYRFGKVVTEEHDCRPPEAVGP